MAMTGTGVCTECGEESVEIIVIDEKTMLCEDCLEELDYILCDECNEYWAWDAVKFYNLTDGRILCQHCFKSLMEDGAVDDDMVELVEDHT